MIICGYTHELPAETLAVLKDFEHVLVDVSDSDHAYFDLLESWWTSTVLEMVTLEHDIIPKPQLLREILDCPRAWCAAMYPFEEHWLFGLGLAKFSLPVRQAMPGLFDEIAQNGGGAHPPRHWCSIDAHMQNMLNRSSGHTACVHNNQALIEHRNPENPGAMKWRSHAECLLG